MLRLQSPRPSFITRCLSSTWKQQRDSDIYAHKAVAEGMRSRAAYKLEEINTRFGRFLRRGACVVDLGASPGGFSLVAARLINLEKDPRRWSRLQTADLDSKPSEIKRKLSRASSGRRHGKLICVDMQDMDPIAGASFVKGDMSSEGTQDNIRHVLQGNEADVVLSDMAPSTSGQKETDHFRIMQLAEEALSIAHKVLTCGGTFCCKVFSGADERAFRRELEGTFFKVKAFKPAASRKVSKEIYYVAQGFVPSCLQLQDDPLVDVELREEILPSTGPRRD